EARTKASELAVQGKAKASEALVGLSRVVSDNAATIDDNLGAKYGDYARSASRKLEETATQLDQKSVEQLGEDAREFVRTPPGPPLPAVSPPQDERLAPPGDGPGLPTESEEPLLDSGHGERSLIEDVEALIEDGRTYLEAEIAYQKTRAAFVADRAKAALIF